MTQAHPTTRKAPRRSAFYVGLACVYALIAVVGFSRRYLFPLAEGSFEAPALVHLHGIITFGWIALVIAQSALVFAGRTSLHRSLGLAGIALGTLLIFTATEIVILLLARGLKEGGPAPREFASLLLSTIVLIAALFGLAIAKVNQPEVHKRLMTMATLVILTPALARIIQLLAPGLTRLMRNDLAGYVSDVLILLVAAWDAKRRGRPHPAYVVGGAAIVVVQLATLAVRSTPGWYAFTDWLARLAG